MSKFDFTDRSPEKHAYTGQMHAYLDETTERLRSEFETLTRVEQPSEMIFRGHHLKFPLMYYIHHQPSFRDAITVEGVGTSKIFEIKDVLVDISKEFAKGLLDTDRVIDYPKDILGDTKETLYEYSQKITRMFITFLTMPKETPLTLTAETKIDEICKTCAIGEHCHVQGDIFSKSIDAIFVDQLTNEVKSTANIVTREKLMSKDELITESKMTLGDFRVGLLKLYPHKKHLYEDTPDED